MMALLPLFLMIPQVTHLPTEGTSAVSFCVAVVGKLCSSSSFQSEEEELLLVEDLCLLVDHIDCDGSGRVFFGDFIDFVVRNAAGGASSSTSHNGPTSSFSSAPTRSTNSSKHILGHALSGSNSAGKKKLGGGNKQQKAASSSSISASSVSGGIGGFVKFLPGLGRKRTGQVCLVEDNANTVQFFDSSLGLPTAVIEPSAAVARAQALVRRGNMKRRAR